MAKRRSRRTKAEIEEGEKVEKETQEVTEVAEETQEDEAVETAEEPTGIDTEETQEDEVVETAEESEEDQKLVGTEDAPDLETDESGNATASIPVVDEKKEIAEETTETKEVEKAPVADLMEVLSNEETTMSQKLIELASNGNSNIKSLAAKLLDYNNALKPGSVIHGRIGAGRQYDLLKTFISKLSNENSKDVKECLGLICFTYKSFADESFGSVAIFRFQDDWRWTENELNKLNVLHTIFSELADHETRAEALKTISLDKAISDAGLSEVVGNNLKNYFNQ